MSRPRRENQETQEIFALSFDHPSNSTAGAYTAGVKATGTVTCVAKANMADTDYMTIGDGVSPAVLYEFDVAGDGVTAGRVQVNISGATSAADVATLLAAAIVANQPLIGVTDNLDGTLDLEHALPGVIGNVTITENVADAGFLVTGMSAGVEPVFVAGSGALTADTTIKLFKVPTGKKMRVERVFYNNPTGLAADAANYFDIQVLKGASTVAANWSTETGQEGVLTADTPVEFSLTATQANRVFTGDDVLSVKFDETGTATLPPGRLVIECRYL